MALHLTIAGGRALRALPLALAGECLYVGPSHDVDTLMNGTKHTVTGDLLELALSGAFDVIVHGANCQCVMGAGIAKAIRDKFPEAYRADLATPKADRSKLGTFSAATITRDSVRFDVVNAYTQFHYRGPGIRLDYDALRAAFVAIATRYAGRRIAYPRIGAGLARGDWARISAIIDEALRDHHHTLVEFQA